MNAALAKSRDGEQKREMPIVDCIHAHSSLCEEVYDFFLEENRLLRSSAHPVEPALLDRKRFLLKALGASLERIRETASSSGVKKSSALRVVSEKAQRILLKAMLLDKENEQLLLKHALSASRGEVQIIPKPTAKQVRRRYESNI
jgi:hypothetical protein